jgi:hypothetical protein
VQYEIDGDVEARIALRAKDLSSPWRYLLLAEFCMSQGREAEALRRAEEGLWVFEEGHQDERLVVFVVERLLNMRRDTDALAHLWRAFRNAPSFELYAKLREFGDETRMRALAFVEELVAREGRDARYRSVDLLIRILMLETNFDVAWAVVRKHGPPIDLCESLARASEATHPREALGIYAKRVEQLAEGGGNRAYEHAAAFAAQMGALRAAAEQDAYVADLKARFGRRRNLMKLLGYGHAPRRLSTGTWRLLAACRSACRRAPVDAL